MRFHFPEWLAGMALALAVNAATAAPAAAPAIPDIGPVSIVKNDSGLPKEWHRKGVFMEILVRAYQDSDDDGAGDLNGVIARLDYLKDLGITGIWLLPIFESADHDHGYAVTNYRKIEPTYGTLADFDRLLAEAHKRGIGVILDYVINHSASAHPMFEDAFDNKDSKFANWYIFEKRAPGGWNTFSGNPWREADSGRWYYGIFDSGMPDYNLRNPAVVEFHMNNLKFWLNRGVDGFRFDAVGVLFENGPAAWENQPENIVLMKKIQTLLGKYGKRYMVCESPSDPTPFAKESGCGSAFAFGLQKHIMSSVRMNRLMPDLLYSLRTMPVDRMGTFLSNHDHFAGNRPFDQFAGNERYYRLAAATLMTLPGHPFVYYGEEIGMGRTEPSRNADQAIRGPMSWSRERPHAGFTRNVDSFRPNAGNLSKYNVANETADPKSLLNWYKALIALRNSEPALGMGSMKVLAKEDANIFSFVREYKGSKLLVLINYATVESELALPKDLQSASWKPLFSGTDDAPITAVATPTKLPARMAPQQVMVFKLVH